LRIEQLDDGYSSQRKKLWPKAFKTSFIFIAILWGVFIIDLILPFRLNAFGIHPRHYEFIPGVLTSIFLHGDLSHLMSNTLPLLLAMTALFGNYPKAANKVFFYSILLTGLLVWCFARSANHIGASGLINALLAFIFLSGFFRRDIQSIGISLVIAFLYGSLLFGIIPNKEGISWESHLFGFITGFYLAWIYRKSDIPKYKVWDYDEDYD
jgi:membrane associated rhomboid family serine protease